MLFLTLSKVEVDFAKRELIWKGYTTIKALPIMKRVQIIDLKEFTKAALDSEQKTFVVYVSPFL